MLTPRISGFDALELYVQHTHTSTSTLTYTSTTVTEMQRIQPSAHNNIVIISHNLSGHNNRDISNKMCKLSVSSEWLSNPENRTLIFNRIYWEMCNCVSWRHTEKKRE